MNLLEAILLGLVQGLTEFLPVSSSGHLVLGRTLLGLGPTDLLFDVTVHMGTLLAVVIYYRHDIAAIALGLAASDPAAVHGMSPRRWVGLIVLGSILAAAVGLGRKSQLEATFGDPAGVAWRLMATGALLFSTAALAAGRPKMRAGTALATGLAQAVAILPGISRSGATISCAMWLGVEREQAARFSFLLSLPAITGAFLLEAMDLQPGGLAWHSGQLIPLAAGFVTALISGYAAVALLIRTLIRGKFAWFGIWCWLIGLWGLGTFAA